MSAGISVQTPLAQQTVSKWIFLKNILLPGQSCSHRGAEVDISTCSGFGLDGAEAEPKQDPAGMEEPRGGCGKLGCACWGGRTFQKKMIFEPSALFFRLSLQEGKPPG